MKRHLLKLGCIITTLCIIFTLSACNSQSSSSTGSSNNTASSSNTPTASVSLSDCVTWLVDKKVENNKYTVDVKIPQINFDKPGSKSINEEIKAKFYTEDVKTSLNGGFEGIQLYIRTEYSLNGNILSLRIKEELYPSYGTDGEVYSVCYDISKDILVTPAQYLKDKGYTYEKVVADTKAEFEKQTTENIESFNIEGIYINDKGQIEVIANIVGHPVKSDSWKYIYYYTVK